MCGRAIQGGGFCVGGGGLHSRGCWHYPAAVSAVAGQLLHELDSARDDDETVLIRHLVSLRAEGATFRFSWE